MFQLLMQTTDKDSFLWIREIVVIISKASSSLICQTIFGAWATVFLNIPNTPLIKFENPFCSLCSVSVCNEFILNIGLFTENALSINSEPSSVKLDFLLISSAMLFTASKTEWK